MLTRKQKEELVVGLSEQIGESKSIVFVDYKGLNMADTSELKKELRNAGVSYRVVKKRLLERAAKNAGIEIDAKSLDGQLAVALSMEDEVAAAKIIDGFAKKHESLNVLGGVLEKKLMSVEEVTALAKLPSKEELLAQLVGSINAPVSGFVNVLAGNMRGLVQALKAISEQK